MLIQYLIQFIILSVVRPIKTEKVRDLGGNEDGVKRSFGDSVVSFWVKSMMKR